MSEQRERGEGTTPAAAGRSVEARAELDAAPERVWRALTEAEELERWFPLEARVEPGVGGTVWMSWKNEFAGASEILAWEPERRLRISWGGWDDDADDYAQVTDYLLEGRGGRTVLRVVTSGFPDDESWDDWVEGTRKGWIFELASLEHYLGRHDGDDRGVVYLRRRVDLPREEAWRRVFSPDALGDRPLGGNPFDDEAPLQYAAVVEDLDGALLRVTLEPCMADPDTRDVTLWLQAWGEARRRLPKVEREWSALLERVFPEGETI